MSKLPPLIQRKDFTSKQRDPSTMMIAILIALFTYQPGIAAENHSAHSHQQHQSTTAPSLNHGKKWQPDSTLRSGMKTIRESVSSQAEPARIAEAIGKETTRIFQNCHLAPQADATLHVFLSDLLKAREQFKNASKPQDVQAARELAAHALDGYQQYFE